MAGSIRHRSLTRDHPRHRALATLALIWAIGCHGATSEPPLSPPQPAEPERPAVPTRPPEHLAASPSGCLATWSEGQGVLFWDRYGHRPIAQSEHIVPPNPLAAHLTPAGDRLFVVADSPELGLHVIELDTATGELVGLLSLPGEPSTPDDLVATGVSRDGRFCLVVSETLYTLDRAAEARSWHSETSVPATESAIALSPSCDRAVVWGDGGACFVGPADASICPPQLGDSFEPTTFAPAWTSLSEVAAELDGRLLEWDTLAGTYREIAPLGVDPVASAPYRGVGGTQPGTSMFLWTGHVVTVWADSARSEWTWPDDRPRSALIPVEGADFWLLREACGLRYIDPSSGETLGQREICRPDAFEGGSGNP